jgi:AcrR family transcriptional regulator
MQHGRRTQAERSTATRELLVAAGRTLFAAQGFGDVAIETIAREAGVTRGALYHHFADKTELYAAVFEAVEAAVIARIGAGVVAAGPRDAVDAMRAAASAWLDACDEPEVLRIALIDAPAVLGWRRWREIGDRYSLRLAEALIGEAIASGRIAAQPVAPLAHVLLGAVREGALYLASASDRRQARRDVGAVLDGLIASLATRPIA